MAKFEVVFLKGRELQSIAFSDKTEEEAHKIANTLNDSLQDKATWVSGMKSESNNDPDPCLTLCQAIAEQTA
jgi:capsular polysaccharide biosynthesis protein